MSRLLPVALILSALVVGCGPVGRTPSTTATVVSKKTYTREEFKKLVMGKSEVEVMAAVGKPDSTSESGGWLSWFYYDTTVDPITSKADKITSLQFDRGKVSGINF